MVKKILLHRLTIHIYWWVFVYLFFIHLFVPSESEMMKWIVFVYFIFLPLPVDLHFFILRQFLKRKKYLLYSLFLMFFLFLFGYLTNIYNRSFMQMDDTVLKNIFEIGTVILIATALKVVKDGFKQKIQLQEIQAQYLQTELQLLKSQMNPHFLFNTLNNLYSLSLDKSKKLPLVIRKLSDLMSYMFESSQDQKVPLKKEIEFINNYLDLEKLRLTPKSNIRFEVEGHPEDRMIAPMLLIPIVENCFKHGVKATTGKFFVHLQLSLEKKKMRFKAENNIGLNLKKPGSGIGLKNVRRRLELLYPNHHNLVVNKKKNVFQIRMEISI